MENFGFIIAISVFLITNFLIWKTTRGYFKKEYGKKMWKNWTARTYYWQGAIYLSTGITFVLLLVLKWLDVLTF